MRIKISELKKEIRKMLREYHPDVISDSGLDSAQTREEDNLHYKLRDIAKQCYKIAKNFKALRGNPSENLMATTLAIKFEIEQLLPKFKSRPEYVFLSALNNDFSPLAKASGKFGKPAFLGKGKYTASNLAAAEQVIKQLARFKKEVLDKLVSSSELVGWEKE